MRFGPYELQVVGSDGIAFAEEQLDGKYYVRAVDGEQYRVEVSIHPDAFGNFPFPRAKVKLHLDGISLDYSKQLNVCQGIPRALFRGFRSSQDTLRSFVFSSPSVSTSSTNAPFCEKTGTIEATIFEAKQSSVMQMKNERIDKDMALSSVQENKKFWQQPSLQTIRGNEFHHKRPISKYLWENLRQEPDATLVLHYHTPAMIDFLRDMHLKKNVPTTTHAAAEPPAHVDLSTQADEAPAVCGPAPVIDLMQDEVRVKREKTSVMVGESRARKRPRTSLHIAPEPQDVVDLT